MIKMKGFTLIELVIVIILVSILAISAAPKILSSDNFEAHTFRSSLLSALRLTQQRAMQQTNSTYCHQIVIASNGKIYGVPDRTDCDETSFSGTWQPDATGLIVEDKYQTTFQIDGVANPGIIGFNGLGVPLGDCSGGCTINISSSVETVQIKIESQGYIRAI